MDWDTETLDWWAGTRYKIYYLLFTVILGFVDWDRPGDSQLMDWDTETLDW